MINKQKLLQKIENRELIIGVIGLGYVGLPLAVEKAKAGFKTIGFDVQVSKVDMVNKGENYIGDVVDADLSKVVSSGKLSATTDFSFVGSVDFIAICVPTPLDKYQQPDISFVKESTTMVGKYLKNDAIVVLESTTYPGTTEELIKPILEKESGLKCGEDFLLGFSPERVDPGNLIYKTKNTPKIVGRIGSDATHIIATVYRQVLESDIFEVSSPKVAEMEKILENTYRNINIALANEMAIICERMNINVWEVIEAAKTKPYGFSAFYPGPGLGGHCIPLDPFYLTWKVREYNYHTRLIEISGEINTYMPQYVVERCTKVLNSFKKALYGANILILGVAYKQNIDDYRESPALRVISLFEEANARVDYFDPYVKTYCFKGIKKNSLPNLTPEVTSEYDIVVITTNHDNVDYGMVQKNAKVIFDTKNAMKNVKDRGNIVLL
jgi:UDP-N-acetyl-D-glucosamine dehydrogenase